MTAPFATKARLLEAREALHKLELGLMPKVVVDQNGEKVEFTSANSARLQAYVRTLETQLGCGGALPLTAHHPVGIVLG